MRSSRTSSGSSSASGSRRAMPGAPQRGLHARAELAHRERLGDVVVGAELEPEDLVDLLGLGGEHDDRDRRARAQAPADLEPVDLRQHHVEHDEVERLLGEARERLAAVGRLHDLVAVLAQREGEQRLDRLLVVDEQDAGGAVGHVRYDRVRAELPCGFACSTRGSTAPRSSRPCSRSSSPRSRSRTARGPLGTTLAPDALRRRRARARPTSTSWARRSRPRRRATRRRGARRRDAGRSRSGARAATRSARARFHGRDGRRQAPPDDGHRRARSASPARGSSSSPTATRCGRAALAELSGTAALLELARVFARRAAAAHAHARLDQRRQRGAAGARDARRAARRRPVDAVLVLGDLGGATRAPAVRGRAWSSGDGAAPLRLRRTRRGRCAPEAGTDPGGARATRSGRASRSPLTVCEQGALGAPACPRCCSRPAASARRRPATRVARPRLQRLRPRGAARGHRARQRARRSRERRLDATTLVTLRKVLPAWAVRLLVGALLLPPLLAAVDGFARCAAAASRSARGSLAGRAAALPFAARAGLRLAAGRRPGCCGHAAGARAAGRAPARGPAATAALVAVALVVAARLARAAPGARCAAAGAARRAAPRRGRRAPRCSCSWCALARRVWVRNPYAAALLVPAAHLLLAVVAPEVRLRRALAVALVVVAALRPFLLVACRSPGARALGRLDFGWFCLLLVAGGDVGPLGWVSGACVLALPASPRCSSALRTPVDAPTRGRATPRITVRGPVELRRARLARRHASRRCGDERGALRRGACSWSPGVLLLADAGAHARLAGAGHARCARERQHQLAARAATQLEPARPAAERRAPRARRRRPSPRVARRSRRTRRDGDADRPSSGSRASALRTSSCEGTDAGRPAQGPGPLRRHAAAGRARHGGDRRAPHDLRRAVPPHRRAAPRRRDRRCEMPYGRFTYRVERRGSCTPTTCGCCAAWATTGSCCRACHPLYRAAQRIVVLRAAHADVATSRATRASTSDRDVRERGVAAARPIQPTRTDRAGPRRR